MGIRSDFARRANDCYDSPYSVIKPLLKHLDCLTYAEPCAGKGDLIAHLSQHGYQCIHSSDIDPRAEGIIQMDAMDLGKIDKCDAIVTNPPWSRHLLHPMIEHFSSLYPTWLLFDAAWIHTKQAKDYTPLLHKVVSIGRVKWIEDSKFWGKDDCCWYLFDANRKKKYKYSFEMVGR